MKKFIVGFLSVFMMLGASILYACTETVELEMSTQTISIQLNSDVEDPSATIYANITGTDDKTLNWSLLEKNDVIEDVEISQLSDGRTAITIEAQNVGKNDIVFTTAHGGVQKTVHVEVYTEVTKILNKPEDVETKSSRFLVKGQTSTLVGADYFTFEPSSSDRTQVSWTFEANGTTSYNGAEIVGDQITLPRQFDGSVVLRATTHLGVSQTVSIACIDPIDISLIDIGGAKTKTGVFEYISSGEVAVEITPNISGDTFENLAYLAVKFSGEVTNNFGGLDLQALVYNEDGSLLSVGGQNVDGSTERLLKVDSDNPRPAQDDGSIEYIFKVQALENRNINDVFFVAFNIGYKDYNYHISSDELGFGRIKVNAKEKIQKVSVTKDEIDASNEMQYLYSNYASSMNGGFGQLFEVSLTPKSVTQASGQIVLSVSTNGLGLHSNLSPVLAYTRSSGAYSEIGLEWDPNSSAFVSQPISSTLTDPLKHQIYLKANPDFFTAENEAGNPDSSFRGIGISFASVDNPKATQANMSVCVVKSSGSIEFETAVDQIKIDSSSVATISQTFTLLGQTTVDGLYIPENLSGSRYVEISEPVFQSTDGENVTFAINFTLKQDSLGLTNSQTSFVIMHENGAISNEIVLNIYLPLTEAAVVCDNSAASITMQNSSDKILINKEEQTDSMSPSVLMLKNGQTTLLSYKFNQTSNGVSAVASIEATYLDFEYDENSLQDKQTQLENFLSLYNGDWNEIVNQAQNSSNILASNLALDHIRTSGEGYSYLVLSFKGIGESGEDILIQRVILVHSYNAVESFSVSSASDTNFTLYASNSVGDTDQVSKTVRISYSAGEITYKDAGNFWFETTIGAQTLTGSIVGNSDSVRWTDETGTSVTNPYFAIESVNIHPSYIEFTIFALSTELAQNAPQLINIYYSISAEQTGLDKVGLQDEAADAHRAQVNFVIINADRVEKLVVDGVDDGGLYFEVGTISDTTRFIVTSTSPDYAKDKGVRTLVVDENGQVTDSIVSVQNINNRLRVKLEATSGTSGKLYIFPSDAVIGEQIIYRYQGGTGYLNINSLGQEKSGTGKSNFEWLAENAFFVNNQQQQISFASIFKSVDILVADGRSFAYAYRVFSEEDFDRGVEARSYFYTVMNDITLTNTHFDTFNGGLQGDNKNITITLSGQNFAGELKTAGREGGIIRNVTFNGSVTAAGFVVDKNSGVIKNVTVDTLGLESSKLTGRSGEGFVGGIAGSNTSSASIENVSVLGLTISADKATVGGVAGTNNGTIKQARVEFYHLKGEYGNVLNTFTGNVVGGVIGQQVVSSASSVYQIYAYDYILTDSTPNNRLVGTTTTGALIGQITGTGTFTFEESFAFVDNMVGQVPGETEESESYYQLSAFVGAVEGVEISYKLSYISYYDDTDNYQTVKSDDFTGSRVITLGDSGFNEKINGGKSYLRYFYQDEKVENIPSEFMVLEKGGLFKAIPVNNDGGVTSSIIFFRAELVASVGASSLSESQAQDYQQLNTIDISDLCQYNKNIIVSSNSNSLIVTGSQLYIQSKGSGGLTLSSKQDVTLDKTISYIVEDALSPIIVSSQNASGKTEQFEHGQDSMVYLQKTMSRQFVAEFATNTVYLGNGADAFEIQMLEKFAISNSPASSTEIEQVSTEFEQVSNAVFAATANENKLTATIYAKISDEEYQEAVDKYQEAVTEQIGVSITIDPIDGAISIGFDKNEISLSPSTVTVVNVTMMTTDSADVASAQIALVSGQVETILTAKTQNGSATTTYSKPDGTAVLQVTRAVISSGSDTSNSGVYQKEFSFRFEVAESYRSQLSADEEYAIKFLSNSFYASEQTLTLKLSKQDISKVDITNYHIDETTYNDGKSTYKIDGATGVMAPGTSSIIQISVNPQYAHYDFMEFTVSGAPIADAVTFLPVEKSTTAGEYTTTSLISLEYMTNGFRFTPSSSNSKYNLYVVAVFNRAIPDCTLTFTATYKVYGQDGQPSEVTHANSYIFVSYLAEPTVTVDGMTSALLAKGGSAQIKVAVNIDQEVQAINISGATNVDYHVVGNPNGEIDPSSPNKRVYTYNLYANILATAGEDNRFYVNATVIRRINNNIETKTAQATVTLVDFKIDEKQTYLEGAVDGALNVYVNINQTLSLNYMFDPQYPSYDASDTASKVEYEEIMNNRSTFEQNHFYPEISSAGKVSQSDYLINVEKVYEGGTDKYQAIPLEDRIYYVTNSGSGENEYVPIKGASEDTSPFIISVDDNGRVNIRATTLTQSSQQIVIFTYVVVNGEESIVPTYVTLQTSLYSDEDLPIMVETPQKFTSLAESEDSKMHNYILMNDIVLESYTPFDTDFISSFDGNGHTIHIRSFDTQSSSGSLNLALFKTVNPGTTLKNIRVNLYEGGNIAVDLSKNTTSNIAGFAITNKGIITNCEVVSFYTDQYAIGASGLNENAIMAKKSGDTGLIVTYNRGQGTGEQIMQNSSSWNSSVAGFVLNNDGNITNSRVGGDEVVELLAQDEIYTNQIMARKTSLENFTIQAQGQMAGFVLQNAGSIAASFVKNLAMTNKSSTAMESKAFATGFVGTSSGKIMTSYVEGVKQPSIGTEKIYARLGSTISSEQCIIAGFILTNSGDSSLIENCYSNILISSSSNVGSVYLASGFVYRNEGRVANCYSASQVENQRYSQMNFSGLDANGDLLASGEYENCYYYDQDYSELDSSTGSSTEEAFKTDVIRVPDAGEEDYFYGFAIATYSLQDGIWAMDTGDGVSGTEGLKLIEADMIAHSYRYALFYEDDQIAEGEPTYALPYGRIIFEDDPTYYIDASYGSSQNPIIIRDAEEFVQVTGSSNSTPIQEQYKTTIHGTYRLVSDIDMTAFNSQVVTLPSTQKAFSGTLYGNGFNITGLSLSYNGKNLSYGLFKSIEKYEVRNSQGTVTATYKPKITGLNIEVASNLLAGDTLFVGTLAGYVKDALLININLEYANGSMVQGRNFTGALAGVVAGDSILKNITVTDPHVQSVRITSSSADVQTFVDLKAINNARSSSGWLSKLAYTTNVTEVESPIQNLSYAGGIVGYVDIYGTATSSAFTYTEVPLFNVSNIRASGQINIVGQVVGGLFGLTAHQTFVQDAGVTISGTMNENASHILSTKYYAGGVIGQSFGFLRKIFSTHEDQEQQAIEDQIASFYNSGESENSQIERGVLDLFMSSNESTTYSQRAIGGLVGQVGSGTLQVSYSNLNVISLTAKSAGGLIGETNLSQSSTYFVDKSIIAAGQYTKYLLYETYASGDVRAYYNNEEGNSKEGNSGGLIGYISNDQDRVALLSTNAVNFFTNIDYRTGQTYSFGDFEDKESKVQTPENRPVADHVYQFVGGSTKPDNLGVQIKFWKARDDSKLAQEGGSTGTQAEIASVGYVQSYSFADYDQELLINLYPNNKYFAEDFYDDPTAKALYQVESISTFTTGTAGYEKTQKIFLNSGTWQQSNWSHQPDQFFPDIRYSLADPTTVYLDAYPSSIEYVLGLMQTNPTLNVIVRGYQDESGTSYADVDLKSFLSRYPIRSFAGSLTGNDNYKTDNGQVKLIIAQSLFESTAIGFSIENLEVEVEAVTSGDPIKVNGGVISRAKIEGSTIDDLKLYINGGVTVTPVDDAAGLIAPTLVSTKISNITIDSSAAGGQSVLTVDATNQAGISTLDVGLLAGRFEQKSSTSNMEAQFINMKFNENQESKEISFADNSSVENLNVGLYFGRTLKEEGTLSQSVNLYGFGFGDGGRTAAKIDLSSITVSDTINAGGYIGETNNLNNLQKNNVSAAVELTLPQKVSNLNAGGFIGQTEGGALKLTSGSEVTFTVSCGSSNSDITPEVAYIGGLIGLSNTEFTASGFDIMMGVKNVAATAANGDDLSPALAVGGVVGYSKNKLTLDDIEVKNSGAGIEVKSASTSIVGIGSLVGYSAGVIVSNSGGLYSDLDMSYSNYENQAKATSSDLYIGGMIGYQAAATDNESAATGNTLGVDSNGIAYLGCITADLSERGAILGGIVGYYHNSGSDAAIAINSSVFGGDIIVENPKGRDVVVGGTIGKANANFTIDQANNYGEVFIDYGDDTSRMEKYYFGGIVGNINSTTELGKISNSNSMVTNHNARLASSDNANALVGAGELENKDPSENGNYYNSAVALAFDNQGTDIGYSKSSNAGFVGGSKTSADIISEVKSGISDDSKFKKFAKEVNGGANWYDNVSKLNPKTLTEADSAIVDGEDDAVEYYVADSSTINYFAGKTLKNVAVVGNFDASLSLSSPIVNISGYSSISGFNLDIAREADFTIAATYGGLVNKMSGDSIIYGIGVNGSMSIGGTGTVTMGGIVGSMTGGLIAESYTNLDMIYRAKNGGTISAIANYSDSSVVSFIDYTYATGSVATYIDANTYAFASGTSNLNISNAYTITKLDLNDYVDGTFAGTPSVQSSTTGTVLYDKNGLNYSTISDGTEKTTTDFTGGSVLKDDNWVKNINFNWGYPTRNFTYLKQSSWETREKAEDSTYKDSKSAYDDYVLTYSYTKVKNGTEAVGIDKTSYAYTIPNAGILANLSTIVTEGATNVALLYDIDLAATSHSKAQTFGDFSKTFDGQDKTITGLNTSLFNTVSGTIRNLRLTEADVDLTSETESFGLLATEMTGGTISNITLEGEINASSGNVGGLVGTMNGGSIDTVTSMVKITGTDTSNVGGIVGQAEIALSMGITSNTIKIDYCSNYGPIRTTTGAAGGIVGDSFEGFLTEIGIDHCFNGGSVLSGYTATSETSANYYAGGIVGNVTSASTISYCYNAGMIKAGHKQNTNKIAYAAGIAANTASDTTISNCYNEGPIEALGKDPDYGYEVTGVTYTDGVLNSVTGTPMIYLVQKSQQNVSAYHIANTSVTNCSSDGELVLNGAMLKKFYDGGAPTVGGSAYASAEYEYSQNESTISRRYDHYLIEDINGGSSNSTIEYCWWDIVNRFVHVDYEYKINLLAVSLNSKNNKEYSTFSKLQVNDLTLPEIFVETQVVQAKADLTRSKSRIFSGGSAWVDIEVNDSLDHEETINRNYYYDISAMVQSTISSKESALGTNTSLNSSINLEQSDYASKKGDKDEVTIQGETYALTSSFSTLSQGTYSYSWTYNLKNNDDTTFASCASDTEVSHWIVSNASVGGELNGTTVDSINIDVTVEKIDANGDITLTYRGEELPYTTLTFDLTYQNPITIALSGDPSDFVYIDENSFGIDLSDEESDDIYAYINQSLTLSSGEETYNNVVKMTGNGTAYYFVMSGDRLIYHFGATVSDGGKNAAKPEGQTINQFVSNFPTELTAEQSVSDSISASANAGGSFTINYSTGWADSNESTLNRSGFEFENDTLEISEDGTEANIYFSNGTSDSIYCRVEKNVNENKIWIGINSGWERMQIHASLLSTTFLNTYNKGSTHTIESNFKRAAEVSALFPEGANITETAEYVVPENGTPYFRVTLSSDQNIYNNNSCFQAFCYAISLASVYAQSDQQAEEKSLINNSATSFTYNVPEEEFAPAEDYNISSSVEGVYTYSQTYSRSVSRSQRTWNYGSLAEANAALFRGEALTVNDSATYTLDNATFTNTSSQAFVYRIGTGTEILLNAGENVSFQEKLTGAEQNVYVYSTADSYLTGGETVTVTMDKKDITEDESGNITTTWTEITFTFSDGAITGELGYNCSQTAGSSSPDKTPINDFDISKYLAVFKVGGEGGPYSYYIYSVDTSKQIDGINGTKTSIDELELTFNKNQYKEEEIESDLTTEDYDSQIYDYDAESDTISTYFNNKTAFVYTTTISSSTPLKATLLTGGDGQQTKYANIILTGDVFVTNSIDVDYNLYGNGYAIIGMSDETTPIRRLVIFLTGHYYKHRVITSVSKNIQDVTISGASTNGAFAVESAKYSNVKLYGSEYYDYYSPSISAYQNVELNVSYFGDSFNSTVNNEENSTIFKGVVALRRLSSYGTGGKNITFASGITFDGAVLKASDGTNGKVALSDSEVWESEFAESIKSGGDAGGVIIDGNKSECTIISSKAGISGGVYKSDEVNNSRGKFYERAFGKIVATEGSNLNLKIERTGLSSFKYSNASGYTNATFAVQSPLGRSVTGAIPSKVGVFANLDKKPEGTDEETYNQIFLTDRYDLVEGENNSSEDDKDHEIYEKEYLKYILLTADDQPVYSKDSFIAAGGAYRIVESETTISGDYYDLLVQESRLESIKISTIDFVPVTGWPIGPTLSFHQENKDDMISWTKEQLERIKVPYLISSDGTINGTNVSSDYLFPMLDNFKNHGYDVTGIASDYEVLEGQDIMTLLMLFHDYYIEGYVSYVEVYYPTT